jgi:cellulose synthase/poly-beta-1,6-N-acetylglucosamine synthase-like glycosyltransferase
MSPVQVIAWLLFSLIGLEILMIVWVLLNKARLLRRKKDSERIRNLLMERYFRGVDTPLRGNKIELMRQFLSLCEQMQLPEDQKERAYRDFEKWGLIARFHRELESQSVFRRKRAIFFLANFMTTEIRIAMIRRLRKEPFEHVKLYLINALKNHIDQYALSEMLESVVGSRRFYQARLIEILKTNFLSSFSHFPDVFRRPEVEIKELFVDLAGGLFREDFRQPLLEELAHVESHLEGHLHSDFRSMKPARVRRFYYRILFVLSEIYGFDLSEDRYLHSSDREVVRIAIRSMARTKTFDQMKRILSGSDGSPEDSVRVDTAVRIMESNRLFFDRLMDWSRTELPEPTCKAVCRVLSTRMDYWMIKLHSLPEKQAVEDLRRILLSGNGPEIIGFLNRNKNKEVESTLIERLQPLIPDFPEFLEELNDFLEPEIFPRFGYPRRKKTPEERPKSHPERRKTVWVRTLLIGSFLLFPITFAIAAIPLYGSMGFWSLCREFIILMNEIFIFYFLTINGVYLILALFSAHGALSQARLWSIKSKSMLFERGMLPSISIIAPAYNEEMSIVESVRSLLHLNYPDFEVIVVNDGSKDGTLERLIRDFGLERKDHRAEGTLRTRPVLAVYQNKDFPNLLVIDKMNGGKADALNVGINFSKNDYLCGIDADSLLESESLLKLMSSMLDHDEITLALGGSIFPVNGCTVDHGQIETRSLADKLLPRLQTIEYLRAFSLGRLGWSVLRSLLIVSGAFGLFEKQILQECGGYLTQSTKEKDTVGEDMELVVRITKQAHRNRLRFRVDFLHNAVCFTEVPEELKSLLRQRNRWQRGLIDILSYHRDMIANPRYRQAGLLGMPYFFLFEMIGPLLEVQGYAAVLLGLAFGLLNIEIVLVLFIVTVVLGILLSLSALLVTENESILLNFRDSARLLWIAILENFGWRQFIAIYRIRGMFSSLKETNTWGTVKRIGFQK